MEEVPKDQEWLRDELRRIEKILAVMALGSGTIDQAIRDKLLQEVIDEIAPDPLGWQGRKSDRTP